MIFKKSVMTLEHIEIGSNVTVGINGIKITEENIRRDFYDITWSFY